MRDETGFAAWLALSRYDPEQPFEAWLRRIALNKCRDRSRRNAVRSFLVRARVPELVQVRAEVQARAREPVPARARGPGRSTDRRSSCWRLRCSNRPRPRARRPRRRGRSLRTATRPRRRRRGSASRRLPQVARRPPRAKRSHRRLWTNLEPQRDRRLDTCSWWSG